MGPVVVITGASAGVGRATARLFAERDGARIGLIARGRERLETAADEVRQSGGKALALPCDVADAAGVEQAAEKVERAFGPIDIWVNCAMATMMAPVGKMTPEEFRRVTEVTYLGSVHGTMSALHRMRQRDRGVIVQVGSALAYRSIPLQSAYCGAKHGIVGFLDSLRSELIHDKSHVRLSVVHLPAVNTPQFSWMRNRMPRRPQPVPPIFQPEVAADAIHFAAHHPRREFWVGRSSVQAIMAQRIAPGLLDRFLARTGSSRGPASPLQRTGRTTFLCRSRGKMRRAAGSPTGPKDRPRPSRRPSGERRLHPPPSWRWAWRASCLRAAPSGMEDDTEPAARTAVFPFFAMKGGMKCQRSTKHWGIPRTSCGTTRGTTGARRCGVAAGLSPSRSVESPRWL